MAKTVQVSVDKLEPGMKLGSSVVTPTGQKILSEGTLLEETHIAFLKRRGIQLVSVSAPGEYDMDGGAYQDAIDTIEKTATAVQPKPTSVGPDDVDVDSIDPGGPTVNLEQMPSETPPVDAPEPKDVTVEEIEKTTRDWRGKLEAREKKMEKKHGESYKKVVKALGEPKVLSPNQKFQPAKLFSDAVKDMTQTIYLEKNISNDTLEILTKNVTLEIVSRQGMSTLLSRAQAAGQYLLAHMVNVGVYSMYLGIQMELSSDEISNLSVGGLLSDIGMLTMPEQFWVHDRDLWKRERDQLKRHPEEGSRMILDCPGTTPEWAKMALEHHERLDGSGYPKGLKGDAVDLCSRIVQICDVYSALTADRAYRDAHFPDEALRHMIGNPKQYDRPLVEIFCQLVGFFPEGYIVLLSSGEHGVVVKTNPKNVFRPVIRLRKDKNGRPIMPQDQLLLDLTTRPDLRIVKILEDDSVRWV